MKIIEIFCFILLPYLHKFHQQLLVNDIVHKYRLILVNVFQYKQLHMDYLDY